MNTEQQLKERAEAILKDKIGQKDLDTLQLVYNRVHGNLGQNVLSAMIELVKQELQRIGEVYQAVGVEENPKESGWYNCMHESGLKYLTSSTYFGRIFFSVESGWSKNMPKPTYWLKKLSLSNVGEVK